MFLSNMTAKNNKNFAIAITDILNYDCIVDESIIYY